LRRYCTAFFVTLRSLFFFPLFRVFDPGLESSPLFFHVSRRIPGLSFTLAMEYVGSFPPSRPPKDPLGFLLFTFRSHASTIGSPPKQALFFACPRAILYVWPRRPLTSLSLIRSPLVLLPRRERSPLCLHASVSYSFFRRDGELFSFFLSSEPLFLLI